MSTTTQSTTRIAGKFVWHELCIQDVAKARVFYEALFGWTIKDVSNPEMAYHMIYKGEKDVAGIWPIDAEHADKVPPHWNSYVSVEDVDATVKTALEAGGQLTAGPYDIPNVGRFAVIQDPTGANITAFRDVKGDRPDGMPQSGEFCWDDLTTTDMAAAEAFYQRVFGWTAKAMAEDAGIKVFHRPDGNMCASMVPTPPHVPSHWGTYVAVDDLATAREKAKSLGATIVADEIPVPGIGRFAIIQDPTGAYLRLFQGEQNLC